MAFSHHIGNTFSGIGMDARTAVDTEELTEDRLQRMRGAFIIMNNVIEGLVSITEVRLKDPLSNTIYIPGVDNIDFYPIVMSSFDTILQQQSLEKIVASSQKDIQTQI